MALHNNNASSSSSREFKANCIYKTEKGRQMVFVYEHIIILNFPAQLKRSYSKLNEMLE